LLKSDCSGPLLGPVAKVTGHVDGCGIRRPDVN
jgi:hypothetical protein